MAHLRAASNLDRSPSTTRSANGRCSTSSWSKPSSRVMAADTDSTLPRLVQEHQHTGGVMDERAEPSHVAAGHFPAPTLGEVPHRQHDAGDIGLVEEAAAHDLHQPPTFGGPHPELERGPDLFALDAHQGHDSQLVVVGMDEIEHARAHHVRQVQLEQRLGGVSWPTSGGRPRR